MTQHERKPVGQKQLELAGFDFGVEQVQASGVDIDQNIVIPTLGLGISPSRIESFLLYLSMMNAFMTSLLNF